MSSVRLIKVKFAKNGLLNLGIRKNIQTSKRIHRFQHSWLFKQNENHNFYDESIGVWCLVFVENEGMFCVLCRSHNTVSPTNDDGTWNSKPCVQNITQAIKLHANSPMHKAAINKGAPAKSIAIPQGGARMRNGEE